MYTNQSPWLTQIQKRPPYLHGGADTQTDIVIVGGGIAGMMTAFFLLQNSEKNILLIESGRLGHGATGHNAGQIAPYLEKGFDNIVLEYGLDRAGEIQRAIGQAWDIIKEVHSIVSQGSILETCIGHAGWSTKKQILTHLKRKKLRELSDSTMDTILIRQDMTHDIPAVYDGLYEAVSQETINTFLDISSENNTYCALGSTHKGVINSALLCEEILQYLYKHYAHRFHLIEHAPVSEISLGKKKKLTIDTERFRHLVPHPYQSLFCIETKEIILCTNGRDKILFKDEDGHTAKVSHRIAGVTGYMAGYETLLPVRSSAISYFTPGLDSVTDGDVYFYVTQRPWKGGGLLALGGPEALHDFYDPHHLVSQDVYKEITGFLKKTYKGRNMQAHYHWHGLMGFTPSGLRVVDQDPMYPGLWYNIGCNGVGILSSVYGGHWLGKYMSDKKEKSVFAL